MGGLILIYFQTLSGIFALDTPLSLTIFAAPS